MSAAFAFHRRHQSRWQSGQRPNFDEALSQLAPSDAFPEEAVKLAKIELRFRLLSDAPRPLDDILRSLHRRGVEPNVQQLGELASQEYFGRWDRGEVTTRRSEYVERFPELSDDVIEWRPLWVCPDCAVEQINELDDERAVEVGCSSCSGRFRTMAVFPSLDPRLDHRLYRLIDEIGTGGMGVVYRAVDPALARELALKKLHPKLIGHREAERRFEREARILGDLQHPGIVPLHSFGRLFRHYPFFTMKLVRGRTFDRVLSELSSSDPARLESRIDAGLETFEKICQAIAFAHERNVVHRDLKPANVMLGQFGEVQVMDWGLAKRCDASGEDADDPAKWAERDELLRAVGTLPQLSDALLKTSGGQLLGTVVYMPREQAIDASSVGPAADVFALGAILCEILTGAPPCLDVGEFARLLALEQNVLRADRERLAEFNAEDSDPRRLAELKRNWEQVCQERDRYVGSLRLLDRIRNPAKHASRGLERLDALVKSRQSASSAFDSTSDAERDRPRDPLVAHLVPLVRACLRDDPAARPDSAGAVEQRLREYFQAVREEAAEQRLNDVRRRQSQVVLVLVSFLALVAIGAALWVSHANVALQRQTRIANQRSRELERQSNQRYMMFADAERNRSEGFLGLPWLGAALRETRNPVQRSALRRSIQTTMPVLPKVRQIYLHDERINTFEYGGDGTHIVTSSGKFARVWPVVYGKETTSPVLSIGHDHNVFHASLNKAGDRLLTMTGDGVNRLYTFPDGRLLHELAMEGLDIQRSSFDASGQWCFGAALDTQSASCVLCVWDAASGELRHRLPHKFPVTAAVLSPKGTHLATISGEEARGDTAWLWDLSAGMSREVMSTAPHQPLKAIAFTHDGKHLATGGVSQEVRIWEAATGAPAGGPLSQPATIRSLEFSHDDDLLIVHTQSDSLHFWQWKTKSALPPLERYPVHLRHDKNVVSSDHRHVLTLDPTRKALRVWSFGVRNTADVYLQQTGRVVSVAQSPDDQYVALVYLQPKEPGDESGLSTLLLVRRSGSGRNYHTAEHASYSNFKCSQVAFSPDSRHLWVSGSGMLVFDLTAEKPVPRWIKTPEDTSTISISAEGRTAIVHDFGRRVYLISQDGDELSFALSDQIASTFSPSLSGDKILISTMTTDTPPRRLAVVLSRDKSLPPVTLNVEPGVDWQQIGKCMSVFTPTADRVVVIGKEGEAVICDAKTGKSQVSLRSEFGAIQHAQFEPRGRYLLTYSANQVELYRADGRRLQSTHFNNAISRATFSPDGSLLVVASGNLAQVWDVETWESITPYWEHDKPITDVQFSPSGRYVITVGADHIVRLWNIADETSYTDEQLVELADFWSEVSIQRGARESLDLDRYAQSWRNILDRFPKWSRSSQLEDAQFHWEQIQYCEMTRDWKTAVSHWKTLLASDNFARHATYWHRYGQALAKIEDWPEVNKAMSRANELAPDNPYFLEWLGYSQVMVNEREAAIKTYELAEALGRNNVILLRNMANNFASLGKYADAVGYYRKVRKLDPHNASNWRHEGAALLAAGMHTEFQEFAHELSESGLMNSSIVNQASDVLATLLLSPELSTEIRGKLTPITNRIGGSLSNDRRFWLVSLVHYRVASSTQDVETSARQSMTLELETNQTAPRQWLLLALNARRQNDVEKRDEHLAKADAWLSKARASHAKDVAILTLLEAEALRREYASTEGTNAPAADVPDDTERLQQAIARLDGEITAQPDDARLRMQRGELLARLALIDEARADWHKAAADFDKVLSTEPTEPHWYRCRGLCLQMAAATKSGARDKSVDEAFAKVTQTLLELFNKSSSPELLFEFLWLSSLRTDLTQAEFQMTVASNAKATQMLSKLWDAKVTAVFSQSAAQLNVARLGLFSGMLVNPESVIKIFQQHATTSSGPQGLYDWYALAILRAQAGLEREAFLALEKGDTYGNGSDVRKAVRELPWHQQVEIRVLRSVAERRAGSPGSPAAPKP